MAKTSRAVVVGVSNYRNPFSKLPAVAADVREIAKVLQSRDGAFTRSGTEVLADKQATKSAIESAFLRAFDAADTAFVYIAGHGAAEDGEYYFIPHDATAGNLRRTGVSLAEIKRQFDKCQSERVFLWLDCCHSGGILARGGSATEDAIIERTLKVVQGQGRVIIAACSAGQSAFEDASHGMFTGALLRGLKGKAKRHGEVTATSLYDFIDREIGSDRQRPMLFGQMTGRIVLMHDDDRGSAPRRKTTKKKVTKQPAAANTVMLASEFVDAESVRRTASGQFEVAILSHDAERDAMIQALDPQNRYHAPMPFAHRNDAFDVQVKSVTAEATGRGQLWNVTLQPVEFRNDQHLLGSITDEERTYSADDIAELRARAILLDERPSVARGFSLLASAVSQTNRGEPIPCPVRDAYLAHKAKRSKWKDFAILQSIYMLKKTGTVEHVLELTIGRVSKDKVAVSFRGRCARQYSNQEPSVIEVSGDCPLA